MIQSILQEDKFQTILSRLINSHPDVRPENCCFLTSQFDSARFIDGYRRIDGQHYSSVTELLNLLLNSPNIVAEILHVADQTLKVSAEFLDQKNHLSI